MIRRLQCGLATIVVGLLACLACTCDEQRAVAVDCGRLCAHWNRACAHRGHEQRSCQEHCKPQRRDARSAGCLAEFDAYANCRAGVGASCEVPFAARPRLDDSCYPEWKNLRSCRARCEPGVVKVVDRKLSDGRTLAAEFVTDGCQGCRSPRPGAAKASPCGAARVCQEVCCRCGERGPAFRMRACMAGECANACSLAQMSGFCSSGKPIPAR